MLSMDSLPGRLVGWLVGALVVVVLGPAVASPVPPITEDTAPYYDPYYTADGMGTMCPMMDCGFLMFMLRCEPIDMYTPQTMINGVECDTCPQCRDFSYYRSLINSTLVHMQEMFERTFVMQGFLDDNSDVLDGIAEYMNRPDIMEDFRELLKRNTETLHDYLMYDAVHVVERLEVSGEKLTDILGGSNASAMMDILDDYSRLEMTKMGQEMSGDFILDNLSPEQLFQTIRDQIEQLTGRHLMIKGAIEETKPVLETLLVLPEDEFWQLWEHDQTTVRVAFKLLEKAKEAIKGLLDMNMDGTASSLQMVIMQSYNQLLAISESPALDIVASHSVGSNTDTRVVENAADTIDSGLKLGAIDGDMENSGDEWEIHDDNMNTLTNRDTNMFFQWLSSRYMRPS